MKFGWSGFGSPLLAGLLLVMVTLVMIVLCLVRLHPTERGEAALNWVARIGLLAGALGTAMVTQVSQTPAYRIDRLDLDPRDDLAGLLDTYSSTVQFVANVALLSWFGFFLPFAVPGIRRLWHPSVIVIGLGFALSGLIEFGQLAWSTGRVSSVSDVMLNTFGVGIGYLVTLAVRRLSPAPSAPGANVLNT